MQNQTLNPSIHCKTINWLALKQIKILLQTGKCSIQTGKDKRSLDPWPSHHYMGLLQPRSMWMSPVPHQCLRSLMLMPQHTQSPDNWWQHLPLVRGACLISCPHTFGNIVEFCQALKLAFIWVSLVLRRKCNKYLLSFITLIWIFLQQQWPISAQGSVQKDF